MRPVSASVATARKGIGNRSNSIAPGALRVIRLNSVSSFCPEIAPAGRRTLPFFTPNSNFKRRVWSSSFRRKLRSSRGLVSVRRSSQSADSRRRSSSLIDVPEAYAAPTSAPMLVPAMKSMGIRNSSSTLITPTCAAPRAPPPERARPILGRAFAAGGASTRGACAIANEVASNKTRKNENVFNRRGARPVRTEFMGSL